MSSFKQEKTHSNTSLNSMASNIVSPSSSKTAKSSSSPSKKKSTSLPAETVDYLKAWMMSPEHIAHPYPTEQEKAQIMADTGIELKQLTNWFVNNRKRYWKPRVEARLQQQVQLPVAAPAPSSPLKRRTSSQQLATINAVEHTPLAPALPTRRVSQGSFKEVAQETYFSSTSFLRNAASQVVVSDASTSASYVSDTASVSSATTAEDMIASDSTSTIREEIADGSVARTEMVDVHILRPLNGIKPTIADVSILSTVPQERILHTFGNRSLTYRFAADAIQDRKKVSIVCPHATDNFASMY